MLRLLILGDIVGRVGRQAVRQLVPQLREEFEPDLVIANAENATSGSGLNPQHYKQIVSNGVDALTLGDHVFKRVQIAPILEREDNIIRPANLARHAKGKRWMKLAAQGKPSVYVVTVLGRIFMSHFPADDPFATVDQVLGELPESKPIVVVEIHAEATSEKKAMGWYLDGRVSCVFGTHTHVQTADARVLPRGTAHISDLGMCGPERSVLGRKVEPVLQHMTTAMPSPFDVAEQEPTVNGVVVDIDESSRRAIRIERISRPANENAPPFVA